MSDNTETLIKNYFNSLVQEFIKDPAHKDITIVFKDDLGGEGNQKTLGHTHWNAKTLNDRINSVKYTISFLNHYEDEERWRGTVVHEFTHLWFFSKGNIDHDHDSNFYSKMDHFEDWLDKHFGLSPRQDKSGDWNQHVDQSKNEERKKKECTSCGKREIPYNTAGECFNCHQKREKEVQEHNEQVAKHNEQIASKNQEQEEYNRLDDLIKNSKDLATLEKNWQVIQNSPLYSNNKRTFEEYANGRKFIDNKTELNERYTNRKSRFQPSQNKENSNTNNNNSTNNEQKEYDQLVNLMKNTKSLSELEKVYQKVKNNSLYDSSKRTYQYFTNSNETREDNKTELDRWYNNIKSNFPSSNETHEEFNPTSSEDNSSNDPLRVVLILVGVIILFFIILIIFASKKKRK